MRRYLLAAALAVVAVLPAYADPTTGAGASRSTDTGGSEKINREKSVSQDKSSGNKSSRSSSREASRERSREIKEGLADKQEESRKRDLSVKLNVNPLLVSEFIAEFEAGVASSPASKMESAREFFAACRPFGNLDADFPVLMYGILDLRPAADGGRDLYASHHQLVGHIVPANLLHLSSGSGSSYVIPITTKSRAGGNWGGLTVLKDVLLPPAEENLRGGSIAYYAACRIAAHFFISQAADATMTIIERQGWKVREEADMRKAIRTTYRHLGDPAQPGVDEFWRQVVVRTIETWRAARCAPFIGYAHKVGAGHSLDCGTFRIAGDSIFVSGVPTLSADAIDGRRIEIALSTGDNDTHTASRESNHSAKESRSSKLSESSENYADSKRTGTMKASRSSDTTTGRKIGRDAKTDTSAKPGQ